MNDTIRIECLELLARIGVTSGERTTPQRLLVSVTMELNLARAGASDSLADTVDYAAVACDLERVAARREWCLIEALASAMAECILSRYPVEGVDVEIRKFILPQARHVAVRIARRAAVAGQDPV